jgi:hypothetical protein
VKSITYYSKKGGLLPAAMMLAALALSLSGCAQPTTGIKMLPKANSDVVDLTAADVVQIMRAAGFSNEQIAEHGAALREGMARSGSVYVQIGESIEVVFAAKGDKVHISALGRGHFYYDVKTGWPQRPFQ